MRIALPELALALALALTAAGPALADQSPTPAMQPPSTEVQYAPITHHDFRGETVDGRTRNPDGAVVEGRTPPPLGSLIRVRDDFRVELLQSAQDL